MEFSFFLILGLIIIVGLLYLRTSRLAKQEEAQSNLNELPEEVKSAKFCMVVKKVTTQKAVEVVVEGQIARGEVHTGDLLEIWQVNEPMEPVVVEKIEILKPALAFLQSTDDLICLYLKGNISTKIKPKAVIISAEDLEEKEQEKQEV